MESDDNKIISVSNLTKAFDDFLAVDHISFAVKSGEVFAFLGPNGAGKSTTIRRKRGLVYCTHDVNKTNISRNPRSKRKCLILDLQVLYAVPRPTTVSPSQLQPAKEAVGCMFASWSVRERKKWSERTAHYLVSSKKDFKRD